MVVIRNSYFSCPKYGKIDLQNLEQAYNTLRGWEDNCGNTILETSLRLLIRICLNFTKEETLLQTNTRKIGERIYYIIVDRTHSATPIFPAKALSTPGVAQSIIIVDCRQIRRNVKIFLKIVQESISRDNINTKRVVCFLDVHGNISLYTNWWSTRKLLRALTLTSSLIFLLREMRIWLRI